MEHVRRARIHSQDSYVLATPETELAITVDGAMMAPVTFFANTDDPVRPYAVAPWADEPLPDTLLGLLARLRGDFFCSAFGGNAEPVDGRTLPPHGETTTERWDLVGAEQTPAGVSLELAATLPLQGGRCRSLTTLRYGESVIYQRHDLEGLRGPACPGHHAILKFPSTPASGRLSFSRWRLAHTDVTPAENPEHGGYSWLAPDREITDLRRTPCLDGSTTDLTRYPARRGFEDVAIVCADPTLEFAWSCATFPEQGYAWFSLRDPRLLASTVLWSSNAGRHYFPFNGRHADVMGVEDVTAFFDEGLAASVRPNRLSEWGIRTHLDPVAGRISIPYIQGVARVPEGFDEVAAIDRAGPGRVCLSSRSGQRVDINCDLDFALTGSFAVA